jgi:multidrug resistance efflux pump
MFFWRADRRRLRDIQDRVIDLQDLDPIGSRQRWDELMATLEELQAASAELNVKIDALIAAVQDVRASVEEALALDAEADAVERQAVLEDIQVKTAKIEAALTPGAPVQPEDLPPAPNQDLPPVQ